MKYPTIKDLYQLCRDVKESIADDYRADAEETRPSELLTVGADETGWSWQTGDNSFTGGAYGYPFWGVVGVYRDSNCMTLAREIKDQLEDASR